MTSSPSLNLTPSMTFGNCFSPFNRRQVFDAAMISLNAISLAVVDESALRAHRSVTNRRKHAFDRVRRPQMIPMFCRKIIESERSARAPAVSRLAACVDKATHGRPVIIGRGDDGIVGRSAG